MGVLYDARNNELAGPLDLITGAAFIDTRPLTVLLASLNAETIMELNGQTTVMIDARSAAFTGTLVLEATIDGINWFAVPFTNINSQVAQLSAALSAASANQFVAHIGGFQAIKVRVSAFTSGNIDVGLRATVSALRPSLERPYPTTLWITATAAANTAATATLPAAGAGLYHYITHIDITRNATAILAGGATLIHTTTNLPGSPAWSVGNNMVAGGTEKDVAIDFAQPLKSSVANTATTVVAAAAGLAVLGRVNVGYFIGA
jgi:hypothetical protein